MSEGTMKVVNTVKLLAGITDNEQDDVILALEEMTRNQLSMMVDETSVPPPLEAVVLPVTLARFNRLGNEGMQSYSQEGESITYPASDFDEYTNVIERYNSEKNSEKKRGKIVFFTEDKVGDDNAVQ